MQTDMHNVLCAELHVLPKSPCSSPNPSLRLWAVPEGRALKGVI